MKNISCLVNFFTVSFLFLGLFLSNTIQAEATEIDSQTSLNSLHIIKYQLTEDMEFSSQLQNGSKIDGVDTLIRVPGIKYEITRMSLLGNSGEYISAAGEDQFSMQIKTNSVGEAVVNGLPDGIYKVIEIPDERIPKVMEPIVINLPMQVSQGVLNEVYVYPKSSVVTPEDSINPPKGTENTPSQSADIDSASEKKRLPETSGNIGKSDIILYAMLVISSLGILSIVISVKRDRREFL
ncbi:pilin N-terminal domain-containing protein [Enterococcus sp. CWB-B31]|uniref:pilin N-terminal domain-containing protein n=1 Tax=Enterococcus sp. CWB-B31 TaxID=2885159 RepID=UPI001E60538D|nr:pilin N-terminal domain-containing protein [Enterococcus sp. CWB-B31]MCB5953523.1 hypothetical protein [Enterococcus sp. CWB-B31]